jgi:hypothetical protein
MVVFLSELKPGYLNMLHGLAAREGVTIWGLGACPSDPVATAAAKRSFFDAFREMAPAVLLDDRKTVVAVPLVVRYTDDPNRLPGPKNRWILPLNDGILAGSNLAHGAPMPSCKTFFL